MYDNQKHKIYSFSKINKEKALIVPLKASKLIVEIYSKYYNHPLIGNKILGIYIDPIKKNDNVENNIIIYIYSLMFIPISQTIKYKLDKISDKCHVIKLVHDKTSIFDFDINSVEKLEMFSSGYQQTKEIFEI